MNEGEMKSERWTKFLFLNFGINEINNLAGISSNKRTVEINQFIIIPIVFSRSALL